MSDSPSNISAIHVGDLCRLVRGNARVMQLLRSVASLGLAQWCIAAGVVRNLVWDHLHGYSEPTIPTDVDVLIFDNKRTEPEYERQIQSALASLQPAIQWEVVNQATVHTYTGDAAPYRSIAEAMSRWVDPMTAVGVSLGRSETISVVAPLGLDDLFSMVVRPHLVAPRAAQIYRDRVASKNWCARWPMVRVEPLPTADGVDSSSAKQ